jgi:hypothetical protein
MVVEIPALYAPLVMPRRPRESYNQEPPEPGTFGYFIWHRRWIELGLSQQELAARIVDLGGKMEQGDISDLERNVVATPRAPRMSLLSRALQVPLGELYAAAGHPDHAEIGASFGSTGDEPSAAPLIEWVETLSDEQWEHLVRLRETKRQEIAEKQSSKKPRRSRSSQDTTR